jgi:proline dehydrogenase
VLDRLPKAVFAALAGSTVLKHLASRYGLRNDDGFARRFIAGDTVADAVRTARALEAQGLTVTLDYLGESVHTTAAAATATQAYRGVIEEVAASGVERNLSVKLTQLGLAVDRATAVDNLRRIFETGGAHGFFVRVDMESSAYTDQTFDAFETLWRIGYRNGGIAIQAYLRRSAADVSRMNALGASVRLVKGAYNERHDGAFKHKAEVDAAYVQLMKTLLEHGVHPAIATHDPAIIAETIRFAEEKGLSKDRYEFEMLYGIRRDLQNDLASLGYHVRVYVPFGDQWFPYFMRRLGERPANVGFVLRSLFREGRPSADR